MKSQDLRSSILQYAMEGKLVPQDSNEESANILLDEIIKEKELLIEKKIIKREKALPKIEKDEIPFKIPTSWEWVRLKDVIYNYGQKKPTEDFCYIDVASIDNTIGSLKENIEILNPENAPSRARKIVKKGSILYSTVRPYLQNICIIDKDFAKEAIASTAFLVMNPIKILDKYLYYTVKSPFFNDYVESKMVGVAYPAINDKNLNSAVIPIPPLSEQERIVEKVEELFQRVDQYHVLEEKISSLNENFPVDMEKSILQYALEGKLVSQNPEEESAKSILRNLLLDNKETEKNSYESNTPFKIPSSWEWVTLNDIAEKVHYGYTASAKEKGDAKLLRITDIQNNEVDWSSVPYCNIAEEAIEKYKLIDNDILIARTGGTIGKSYIIHTINETSVFASYLIRVQLSKHINPHFIKKFLESPLYWTQLKNMTAGTGQPNVNATNLKKLFIPIPPLREQDRILEEISNFDYHIKNLNNSIF